MAVHPSQVPIQTASGGNALLAREIRAALRNVRAFALLAIYVAALGAIVVSQFPSEANVDLQGGGQKGRELFTVFLWAQAFLVVAMLPSLAVGALAQERERQTLQPLLLTPMTPLQIVWGKAGGALALAFILLLATLPLTSLCFLLGGVSPGELLGAYAALLGLALFCIGVGLYCAAHWKNTTQATLISYLILPPSLGVMALFALPGIVLAGIVVVAWGVWGLSLLWKKWEAGRLARTLKGLWWPLFWLLAAALVAVGLWLMGKSASVGFALFGAAFVVPYMAFAAQTALQQAAREIGQNLDPDAPLKERVRDFKTEWQAAVAPPPQSTYLPQATGAYSYTPQAPVIQREPPKPTYGIEPFLPLNLNPIYAREMRAGLAGKGEYFFRFGYVATIGTELLMLLWMTAQMQGSDYASDSQILGMFSGWARLHLALLMLAAAWLGARAFAPEREGQTLPQLLTIPMPASQVAWGKFLAVAAQTGYAFLLGAPLALLLGAFGFVAWGVVGKFFALELACGAFAAAWGLWCSIRHDVVRRALGWALGGVAFLIIPGPLFGGLVLEALQSGGSLDVFSRLFSLLWPLPAMGAAIQPPVTYRFMTFPDAWLFTALGYGATALVLFAATAHAFRRYTQSV